MNKTEKILVKISEDREELKKFLEQETMDDMYEFVLSKDSSISEEEFDESVAKLLEDYSLLGVEKVNEDTLVNVSGGAAEFGKKATSAGLAALMLLPLSAPSASATNPSEGQPSTSRFKKFVSDSKEVISNKWGEIKGWFNNHPVLSSFIVTAATLATVIVVVAVIKYNKSTSEGDNKVLDSLSEENSEAPGSLAGRRVSEVMSPERKHEDEVDFEINLPVLTEEQKGHMSKEQIDAYDNLCRIRYADKSGMTSDQLKKWKEDFVNAKRSYDDAITGVAPPAAPPSGSLVRKLKSEIMSPELRHEDEVDFEINLPVLTETQEEHMSREQRDAYDSWRRIRYADKSGMTSDQLKKWKEDFVNAKRSYDYAITGVVSPKAAPSAAPSAAPPAAPAAPSPAAPPPPPPPPAPFEPKKLVIDKKSGKSVEESAKEGSESKEKDGMAVLIAGRQIKAIGVVKNEMVELEKLLGEVPTARDDMMPQQKAVIDKVVEYRKRLDDIISKVKGIVVSEELELREINKLFGEAEELGSEARELEREYSAALGAVNDPDEASAYMDKFSSPDAGMMAGGSGAAPRVVINFGVRYSIEKGARRINLENDLNKALKNKEQGVATDEDETLLTVAFGMAKKYRDEEKCTDTHNKWCYDILLKDDPKLTEQFRGIRERFAKLGILE